MSKGSWPGVLSNPNYAKLFYASIASQMGSVIGLTAFTFYLLDRFSNQPTYATLTEMMNSLPTLAVFFLVGVLADRLDRQKIAYFCDFLCMGLTILLIGAVQIGWMPLMFAVLFARSAVVKFFPPAQSALIQGVLSKDEQVSAAGLNQTVSSVFLLVGNGLGAVCYWNLGVSGAIVVDALSFLASALLIRSCKMEETIRLPNGEAKWSELKLGFVWENFREGALYIYKYRLLSALMLGLFFLGFVIGGLEVLPLFIMRYKLAPDHYQQVSVVMSVVFGLGILIGSPIVIKIAKKVKLYQLMIAGFGLGGLALVLGGLATTTWFYGCTYFLFALTIPLVNIPFNGWMSQIVDRRMMGRVQGWKTPIIMVSQSLTLGVISVVYPVYVHVETLFFVIGAALLLVTCYYFLTLPGYARQLEKEERKQGSSMGQVAEG